MRLTAIATARAALRNVAIAMGQMERATTATMASAATDRRMQPRVQKISAEIGASGARTEVTAATASAGALGNVAMSISTAQIESATTARMASAATDRRMQPRVCKLAAEIEAALKELTEGVKEGAKIEDIAAVALTESVTVRLTTAGT